MFKEGDSTTAKHLAHGLEQSESPLKWSSIMNSKEAVEEAKFYTTASKLLPTLDITDSGKSSAKNLTQPDNIDALKLRIEERFNGSLTKEVAEHMQNMMARFEERAISRGLGNDEIAAFYKSIEKLTSDKYESKFSQPLRYRLVLATEIIRQAAEPSTISQGAHGTCEATAVEVKTFAMHPAIAAKFVTDVALQGAFTSPKNAGAITVHINPASLVPDSEANHPQDGSRSYATQIFNLASMNLYHKMKNDRLVYANGQDSVEFTVNSIKRLRMKSDDVPGTNEVASLYDAINGTNRVIEPVTVATIASSLASGQAHREPELVADEETDKLSPQFKDNDSGGVKHISSEKELTNLLLELKRKNQLPLIVVVHAMNQPFWLDGGKALDDQDGHAITVSDVDDTGRYVCLNNQWGRASQHDGDKAITVDQLFVAMHPIFTARDALERQVQERQERSTTGMADHDSVEQRLELVRLQYMTITKLADPTSSAPRQASEVYVDQLKLMMSEIKNNGKEDSNAYQRQHLTDVIRAMASEQRLPADLKSELEEAAKEHGFLD